jgi:hypothetical protein
MREAKQRRLAEKGWKTGDAKDFLGLSKQEEVYIESCDPQSPWICSLNRCWLSELRLASWPGLLRARRRRLLIGKLGMGLRSPVHLNDGQLPIHNNRLENRIRPVSLERSACGRRAICAWLSLDTGYRLRLFVGARGSKRTRAAGSRPGFSRRKLPVAYHYLWSPDVASLLNGLPSTLDCSMLL